MATEDKIGTEGGDLLDMIAQTSDEFRDVNIATVRCVLIFRMLDHSERSHHSRPFSMMQVCLQQGLHITRKQAEECLAVIGPEIRQMQEESNQEYLR